ncbi:MAG TPA: type II toxin-antitoxin system VapC family toxin [Candidatus Moranbacteria bacterium]|nr:type II toxin-antitoxin system VapC family toxin [Candidatus Moranbacteria bacterium]
MIILDSNIWIAYLNKSDSTHQQSLKIFQKTNAKDILMTEYLLLEIVTVLKQIRGYKFAQEFIQLVTDENIPFIESKNFYAKTLLLFQSLNEDKLSFVDVSLLHLSKKYELRTFDKDLRKMLVKK